MVKKLFFVVVFLISYFGYSQLTPITKDTKVSLLTVGTSNEAHSLYGHTAIRINDVSTDFDFIYNYGMFDFSTENFVLKFVKGDMKYFAAAYPYQDFEYSYRVENRSIYEQVLNLSLAEKQKLFEKLNISLAPESKFYTYKFIDRNCTTKLNDVLNVVLEKSPIVKKNFDEDKSYRDVLYPYAANAFYQKLGINIIFGTKVDQTATKIFLPFDLYENVKNTTYHNKPLVTASKTLFKASKNEIGFSFLDSIYSLILVLILILIFNSKIVNIVYFLVLGLLGIFFSLVGFYSFHQEISWNYNVLLFNPLYLILVFFMIKNNQKGIMNTTILCLSCLGFYLLYMINKIHFFIMMPFIVTNIILLFRQIYKKINLLSSIE